MIRVWDGILSLFAAFVTAAIIGIPGWAAFLSIRYGIAPSWVYVPLVLLGLVGLIMIFAFLRKTLRGIHPMRERRR